MALSKPATQDQMKEPSDFDLLLIGKTGNGKSDTGNSILRRRAFKSRPSTSSVTTEIECEVSEFKGKIIKVVDCPGVGDTRINNEKALNLVLSATEKAIEANPRGYHALLLVVRFGGRFTVEDKDTIAFLKKMFGQDFVRNYGILVLTCGDNFEQASEETGQSFQEWCCEQDGVFNDLYNECENRAILFDNATKDEKKKIDQVDKLLTMVDSLRFRGHRYTDEHFSRARETRERLIIESKKPMVQEATMVEASLIMQKIQELQLQQDLKVKIEALKILKARAEKLGDNIKLQDCGTGALKDVWELADKLCASADEEIRFCVRMIQERENMEHKDEETRRMLEKKFREQLEKERSIYEARLNSMEQKYQELKKSAQPPSKGSCNIL